MRVIRLQRPVVEGPRVTVAWTMDPGALYTRHRFSWTFPEPVEAPERFWLALAMLCLHSHWVLLRPVRIHVPHRLLPGERERWLRLMAREAETLEAYRGEPVGEPGIDLVEGDLALPAPRPLPDGGRCATCFSGGRDSLAQAGLLQEFTERPLLVATTSPLPPLHDHGTRRRRDVFAAMAARRDLEFVEVHSDFRASWDNGYTGRRGYPVSVNAVTDTFLYTATAFAAAWARGINRVYLAAENEVSETAEWNGSVIQFHHYMYSAPVQAAIEGIVRPWGFRHGSLMVPLQGPQVQALLWRRYPGLAVHQYSCWKVPPNRAACSRCSKCLLSGLGAAVEGRDPALVGIDLATLLTANRAYRPKQPTGADTDALPLARVTYRHHANILAYLRALSLARLLRLLARRPPGLLRPAAWRAVGAFLHLRRRLAANAGVERPGLRAGYAVYIDPWLRERVMNVYRSLFDADPEERYGEDLARSRTLAAWMTETSGGENHGESDK